ncbi:hypothetical protein LZ30DRAFT_405262 [Colletotrichum cereale]|nr:hypothetical protein LZ30DRAFT_405262 [Colletotrichum cereale]
MRLSIVPLHHGHFQARRVHRNKYGLFLSVSVRPANPDSSFTRPGETHLSSARCTRLAAQSNAVHPEHVPIGKVALDTVDVVGTQPPRGGGVSSLPHCLPLNGRDTLATQSCKMEPSRGLLCCPAAGWCVRRCLSSTIPGPCLPKPRVSLCLGTNECDAVIDVAYAILHPRAGW